MNYSYSYFYRNISLLNLYIILFISITCSTNYPRTEMFENLFEKLKYYNFYTNLREFMIINIHDKNMLDRCSLYSWHYIKNFSYILR